MAGRGDYDMKKHGRIVLAAAAVALAAAAVLGIYFLGHRTAGTQKRIIFIPKIIDEENDFWVQLLEGAGMAAQEYGMEITVAAPEQENDFQRQNELINWAVSERPDAIMIAPSSYTESAAAVNAVRQSGIPLVLVDSDVEGGEGLVKVATDNVEAGRVQGDFMKGFLYGDVKIALVCHVEGSSTALEREKGVRRGLGEYEDRIVDVVFCDSDYDKAYSLMNEIIDRHPDVTMVAGLNEYSAVGAARAIIDRGLTDQISMVGFDSSLEEIQLLEEGVFEGIVIQNPYKMGYLGAEAAAKMANGEKVNGTIDSGCKLVTKEEVFTEENQKILFMFTEE